MARLSLGFNLEDVSSTFEPIPAGTYIARIVDVELKKSSKGNDMLSVKWTVIDGPMEGKNFFDNVVLSVEWKVKQYAELIGVESGNELDTEDLIGAEATVTLEVKDRTDGNGQTNQVKSMEAFNG